MIKVKISFLNVLLQFRFGMLHEKGVTNSYFSPIRVTEHNASSRASCSRRVRVVRIGAALTAVNEKVSSPTHF